MNNLSCIWLRPFPLFPICPPYFPCNWRARTQNSPDDAWTNGCDFVITKCVKPAFEKAVESRSDRPSTYTFSGHCHWVERESLKIYITGRYLLREIDPILSFKLTRRLFELIWHNDIPSWRLLREKKKNGRMRLGRSGLLPHAICQSYGSRRELCKSSRLAQSRRTNTRSSYILYV